MAEGVEYNVVANLRLDGADKAKAGLDAVAGKSDALAASFAGLKSGLGTLGGGMVDLGMSAVTMAAKIGVGTLAAGLAIGTKMAMGIGANLSMLEDSANQLGAVIGAATGSGFAEGKRASTEMFNHFRRMAIDSAGETKDFVDIAKMISGPILGAGKDLGFVEKTTQGVVNVATAAGISFEQAGADVMRMSQGMAGAHEPTFRFLKSINLIKESSEEFNKLAPDKRMDAIAKALGNKAINDSAEAFGASFTGLKSTVQDQVKSIGGIIGGPTFELIKKKLGAATLGMTDKLKGGDFDNAINAIGVSLGTRFGQIGEQLKRIFPDLSSSADTAMDKIADYADRGMLGLVNATTWVADHWGQITGEVHKFAGAIEGAALKVERMISALGGGDMTKGLERAAMVLGGGRAVQAAAPMAGGAIQVGSSLLQGGKALGLLGGGAEAAAGAAGGAEAAAGMGALAAGGTVAAVAVGVLAAAFVAFEAVSVDALGVFRPMIEQIQAASIHLEPMRIQLGLLWDAVGRLFHATEPLISAIGTIAVMLSPLGIGFAILAEVMDPLLSALNTMAHYATMGADALTGMVNVIKGILHIAGKPEDDNYGAHETPNERPVFLSGTVQTALSQPAAGKHAETPKPPGKQGVEVTIKWDLGEGDAEDLFIRTRKSLLESMKAAKMHPTTNRLPGL